MKHACARASALLDRFNYRRHLAPSARAGYAAFVALRQLTRSSAADEGGGAPSERASERAGEWVHASVAGDRASATADGLKRRQERSTLFFFFSFASSKCVKRCERAASGRAAVQRQRRKWQQCDASGRKVARRRKAIVAIAAAATAAAVVVAVAAVVTVATAATDGRRQATGWQAGGRPRPQASNPSNSRRLALYQVQRVGCRVGTRADWRRCLLFEGRARIFACVSASANVIERAR